MKYFYSAAQNIREEMLGDESWTPDLATCIHDAPDWYDVAACSDAVDRLGFLLDMLHKGKIDECRDEKDRLLESYIKWRLERE